MGCATIVEHSTPEFGGVHFGVYADAGATGGSLIYNGVNGLTLGQITALGYTYNYTTSADVAPIAAPYLRVFLDADPAVDATADPNVPNSGDGIPNNDIEHDVIFDPSICATASPAEDEDHVVDVTAQTVRYDDDGCTSLANQQPFAAVRSAHAT